MQEYNFDLLLLHKEKDNLDPRKWILARGDKLKVQVANLLNDILPFHSKTSVINQIAANLGCKSFLKGDSEIRFFFEEVRTKIESNSITKSQLAGFTGTSGKHFNKILLGDHFPSCTKIQKLQKHLGKFETLDINCKEEDFCFKKISYITKSLSVGEVSLAVLRELLDMWKTLTKCTKQNGEKKKNEILSSIKQLKINQYVSIWLKAPIILDENFSKIIGSFCADGSFSSPDMFRWEEEHKSNLKALCKWLHSCFGLECNIVRPRFGKNSWLIRFRSKVFARYMEEFFDFGPGLKQYTVRAPVIIRNSPQSIQKAFAMGALMFDGSVNSDGTIIFTVASKAFRDDVVDIILQEASILHVAESSNIKNHWCFCSGRSLDADKKEILLSYFETATIKWIRLKEHLDGFNCKISSIGRAANVLGRRFYHFRKPSIIDLLFYCEQNTKFDVYDAMLYFETKRKAINDRLTLLEASGILTSVRRKRRTYNYIPDTTTWKLPSQESF